MFGKFLTIGFTGVQDAIDRDDECNRAAAGANRPQPAALTAVSRASTITERVAHDPARLDVQNHGGVDEANDNAHLRYITDQS